MTNARCRLRFSSTWIILVMLSAVLELTPLSLADDTRGPYPRHQSATIEMVAHRGANLAAPENTFVAAELALERGAAWVEIDIRTSQDGVMYLMHDHTVDRTTDGSGVFAEMNSTDIDRLDAGAWFGESFTGESVPRLRDFLAWAKGKTRVYVDVKAVEPEAFVSLLRDTKMRDDVFFWSGDDELMNDICLLDPDLRHKRNANNVEELISVDDEWSIDIVETCARNLTQRFLAEAESRGIQVMAHLLDDKTASFRQAVQMDVDLANLDHLQGFKRIETATLDSLGVRDKHDGAKTGGVASTNDGGFVYAGSMGHSHNDYYRDTPLLDALDAGMLSIEVDVYHRDNELFVAHDPHEIRADRTLRTMYLDPLRKRFEALGGHQSEHPFGGRVRKSGRPLILMVDLKSGGDLTWRVLERQLRDYADLVREVRTRADGESVVSDAPVVVVVSGNRPQRLIEAARVRRTAIDGRFPGDLESERPPHLMPMISTSFSNLISDPQQLDQRALTAVLDRFAEAAGKDNRLARVWATPDHARAWRAFAAAGMQLINTDRPSRLARFFTDMGEKRQAVVTPE